MEAALRLSGWGAGERNDGAALASSHLWDHLDRAALFFQSGADAGDEEIRSRAANQDVSRANVRRDGLVPVVCVRDGAGRLALFHDSSVRRCETCGRSFADWQVVWLVAAGVARPVQIFFYAAHSRQKESP